MNKKYEREVAMGILEAPVIPPKETNKVVEFPEELPAFHKLSVYRKHREWLVEIAEDALDVINLCKANGLVDHINGVNAFLQHYALRWCDDPNALVKAVEELDYWKKESGR